MPKLIISNKFIKSNYEIDSTYECGISLLGWEVKSLRAKNAKLDNSFCSISNNLELLINNLNIAQYMQVKGDLKRSRKLLMHKSEILKLKNKQEKFSFVIVPTSIYWSNNHIKVEIALAKALKKYDKRAKERENEIKKQIKSSY